MAEYKFSVDERVVTNHDCIGTVLRITPTGRVVVDFGTYKETYRPDGSSFSNDVWNHDYIHPLTPEREQKIREGRTIRYCIRRFRDTQLSYKQAQAILMILEENDGHE